MAKKRWAFLESFYCGSHKYFLDSLIKYSTHEIIPFTLPGRHFKWRMHGGALSLANLLNESKEEFEGLIVTSLTDISLLKAHLDKKYRDLPIALYFHENQFIYPPSPRDRGPSEALDFHYPFINLTSAMVCDFLIFNSTFNKESFFRGARKLLNKMPDFNLVDSLPSLEKRAQVIPLGIEISERESAIPPSSSIPHLIWNHRLEYDKGDDLFFHLIEKLVADGVKFNISLLGLGGRSEAKRQAFKKAFPDHCLEISGLADKADYWRTLRQGTHSVSCARHEFFGLSCLESAIAGQQIFLPKKLSYPEIFGENFPYYNTEQELFEQMRSSLRGERHHPPLDSLEEKYNWREVIYSYDKIFSNS